MSAEVFVDTNIWLYALVLNPGEEAKHRRAHELVASLGRCTISTQVIAEVSVNLLKKAAMQETALVSVVEDFYRSHHVQQMTLGCHRRASELRTRYRLSYWDSLILAAADEAGCAVCYSEDMQDGLRINQGLQVLNPFTQTA
ncbi:hypothetical protein CKO31_02815 [Thiohalocapsa halophila]|uniref:PIN domain-containing protein n=1 Tax=Thiohalocapsa halophila TaxID=69359 RepID=A0ABS1CCS7_9GAMM|nr:PIN domain-containing protein [Thiohalocapsa halophila]MBK1629686.1 hypothetical protein [Thiohalocapsa halophila]